MNKRLQFFLIVSLLVVTGAGCRSASPQLTVMPELPERVPENMAGDFTIEAVEINKHFALQEHVACDIALAYPNLANTSLPTEVRAAAEQQIAQFLTSSLNSVEDNATLADIESWADDYLETCQQEITDEYQAFHDNGDDLFMNLERSVEVIYDVKLNQDGRLSFGLNEYAYTGGAHPNQFMRYFTLDAGANKILTLGDIINPTQLKPFLQYAAAQLLADNRDLLYPEATEGYDALINDSAEMSAEEQLETYGDQDNFFLTPTGLVLYYNTYDIAPYAAGPLFVELPYADLTDFLVTPLAP